MDCPETHRKLKSKIQKLTGLSIWNNLGINKNLTFKKHVQNIINRAKFIRYTVFPTINRNNYLNLFLKTYIYKSYIQHIITYASPAWTSNLSQNQ